MKEKKDNSYLGLQKIQFLVGWSRPLALARDELLHCVLGMLIREECNLF